MSDRDGKGQPTERAASLRIHSEEGVCWVTIDRPGDRNALDSETIAALGEQLAWAEGSGARVIVYRGGGDTYFIGGADGVEMFELDPQGAREFSERFQGLLDRMEASPLLLIAAIDGLCFGGGLEFALACDLRVATDGSRLGLPEVKLGIIPGGGGTQRLPRVVGFGRAVEMILGGHLVSAREAFAMGLVHAVVPDADIGSWARKRAERACALPAFALSAAKRAVYAARDLPLARGLALEAEEFAGCFTEGYFAQCVREQLEDGRLVSTRIARRQRTAGEHGDL